ncbi:hypothetical protein BO98_02410 [Candidatus Synechococcus spongiarum LMB bulk10D]|nr:hypothetical protein BO98_02410 [Candidatus Synechococcus spongiarum LMB bulk10D]
MSSLPLTELRRDLIDALPADVAQESERTPPNQLYLPWSHRKALRLESSLVIGARGVGKSVWNQALQDLAQRERNEILGTLFPYPLQVKPGFGTASKPASYPPLKTFDDLLKQGYPPHDVWQAVLCRALATTMPQDRCPNIPVDRWQDTVAWVANQSESVAVLIEQADHWFQESNKGILLVFDALDRVISTGRWQVVNKAIRDLLRLVLQLKASRRLHAKVFLRTDQYERGNFAGIPDLSKLQATRVELVWSRIDLHGLLWQRLTNAPAHPSTRTRDQFRIWCQAAAARQLSLFDPAPSATETTGNGERWDLPVPLQQDDQIQRNLFAKLAGQQMGRDYRRGVPYLWIVNHLADGQGEASPRSFLAAIRRAAEDSLQRYANHPLALHYESLKRGVQHASEIRMNELAEDHPWIRELMKPLKGLSVPCTLDQLEQPWKAKFGEIPDDVPDLPGRLPERLAKQGLQGVTGYLEQLGLIEFMGEKHINMPDLYRVGFGLGRRGGIKPALRSSR